MGDAFSVPFILSWAVLIAELSRARRARRGAPWVRKFGNLCIQEIWVLRRSTVGRTFLRTSTPRVSRDEILHFKHSHVSTLFGGKSHTFSDF